MIYNVRCGTLSVNDATCVFSCRTTKWIAALYALCLIFVKVCLYTKTHRTASSMDIHRYWTKRCMCAPAVCCWPISRQRTLRLCALNNFPAITQTTLDAHPTIKTAYMHTTNILYYTRSSQNLTTFLAMRERILCDSIGLVWRAVCI